MPIRETWHLETNRDNSKVVGIFVSPSKSSNFTFVNYLKIKIFYDLLLKQIYFMEK